MGSVSTGKKEKWEQRCSSWQGQLHAPETLAGRERELLAEKQWEEGFKHLLAIPCSAEAYLRATLWSPLPPSTTPALKAMGT